MTRARRPGPWRILHLSTSSTIGGTERATLDLARALDPDRFAHTFVALGGPGDSLGAAAAAGFPTTNVRAGIPIPWNPLGILRLIRVARRTRPDLVQTYGFVADVVGRVLKPLLGGPRLVSSIRSVDAARPRWHTLLDRWTAGAADLFISNSEAGRLSRIERERIAPGRIITIHSGIELDPPGLPDRVAARESVGIDDLDRPVIAHIANLRWMKGHDEVLEAAATLRGAFPDAVWLLVGRDDSGGRHEHRAAELGLGDRVRFLGFHPEPRAVLRAADLAILPSRYEGLPVAILEAMAEGKPIVATAVGGIPELVRDGDEALLIPPGDATALATAIERLATDPALAARLGAAARSRAEADFAREVMVGRYAETYARLIDPAHDRG
jgi:L-malate glycosyltransferase